MSLIPIPRAGLSAGRAAQAQPVQASRLGEAVASFGQTMAEVGTRLEADRKTRELARFRIDATERLAETRLAYESEADPDRIATGFTPDVDAMRDDMLGQISGAAREDARLAFDALVVPHKVAIGSRELTLRKDTRIQLAEQQRTGLVSAAAAAGDPETEGALLDQYADTLDSLMAQGDMTRAEAMASLEATRGEAQAAFAIRLLTDDPQALYNQIDSERFDGLPAAARARLRNSADTAIRADQARADAEVERAAREAEVTTGNRLTEIATIAGSDRLSADEAFLDTPEAQAHPDFPAAASAVALRTALPGFATLPPAEMRAQVEDERSRPIGQRYEGNVLNAMEATLKRAETAWRDDPIAHASEVFGARTNARLPAPMPALDGTADDDLAGWMKGRNAYGQSLSAAGYIDREAYFTKAERAQLAAAAGPDQPPERRARIASLIAGTFGPDRGVAAVREIGGDDMTVHAGSLVVSGGPADTALAIFEGQDALKAGNVNLGSSDARNLIVSEALATGGLGDVASPAMIATLRTAADAIYASTGFGADPSESGFIDAYGTALSRAMGAAVNGGDIVSGGIQDVNVGATDDLILPPGVTADQVRGAFDVAERALRDWTFTGAGGRDAARAPQEPSLNIWTTVSEGGGAPFIGGKPITTDHLGNITIAVRGNDRYALQVIRRGVAYDITDSVTGDAYTFRMTDLIREAAR